MNYRHTQHARSLTSEPYLLQPMAFAQVNTALANPGRMAVTEAMAPAPAALPLQQPCKGIVCNFDAACPDHHCPGHPFNGCADSGESEDPTDFAGLERPADEPSPYERTDYDPKKHPGQVFLWGVFAACTTLFVAMFVALVLLAKG
jgi:hypothetical protein